MNTRNSEIMKNTDKKIYEDNALSNINRLLTKDYTHVALFETIFSHFVSKGKIWPNVDDSFHFLDTEIAEAKELLLAKKNYRRNNPDKKEPYSSERLAEELGDALYMVIVKGIVTNTNPIHAMLNKMKKDLEKEELEK